MTDPHLFSELVERYSAFVVRAPELMLVQFIKDAEQLLAGLYAAAVDLPDLIAHG
jgi:hypothetical protein